MSDTKKYSKRTTKKGSENNTTMEKMEVENDDELEDEEDDEKNVKHCICDSRDYTTLMICCDYCSIWYHVECMNVNKSEVKVIEKYACKICTTKDPSCKTLYKKAARSGRSKEKELSNNDKKKQKESVTANYNRKKASGKKEFDSANTKNVTIIEKVKERSASTSNKSGSSSRTTKDVIKEEPTKTIEGLNTAVHGLESTNRISSTEDSILDAVTLQQQRQLELQEANPTLRCGNCIGCFRDKDCGKCFTCIQKKDKYCLDRVCVQVEELLKQQIEKKVKTEAIVEILMSDGAEIGQKKSKKGRKPKHLTIKAEEVKVGIKEKKRYRQESNRDDQSLNAQLTKAYSNWMRSRSRNRPLLDDRQCLGPDCTNSSRIGSKYCSETCGMALAELRLKMILPQRFNAFFASEPNCQVSDSQRIQLLEEQISTVNNKLEELEQWKDNLHQFVVALKEAHPSAQKQSNDEENLVVGCPVCMGEFSMRESGRHIQSCFVRSERQTTYGTDYQIPNNQYNLYCEAYNKINKTYCKRLRYVCSEHYKDEYDLKVCGCPLDWYKGNSLQFHDLFSSPDAIMREEGFCQEKQKNCRDHKNWVQTAFSLIDNERMNLMNRMDELLEQKHFLHNSLIQRGNILSLLCSTTDPINRTSHQ